MDKTSKIVRYPLRLRLDAILAPILSIGIGVDILYLGYGTIKMWNDLILFKFQCIAEILGLLSAIFFIAMSRSIWFNLYSYRVDGDAIEVIPPFFGRHKLIDLVKVSKISTFVVFGEYRFTGARVGHILTTEDGESIKLSEALPLWGWISDQCNVSPEPRPNPWWEITR